MASTTSVPSPSHSPTDELRSAIDDMRYEALFHAFRESGGPTHIHRSVRRAAGQISDNLAEFSAADAFDLLPALAAGYDPTGRVKGLSVSSCCSGVPAGRRLVVPLPVDDLVLAPDGLSVRLQLGSNRHDFDVYRCMQRPVPSAPIDSAVLSPDAAAAIERAVLAIGGDSSNLAGFVGSGVVSPTLAFVWDKPWHGTLFPPKPIGRDDAIVYAPSSGQDVDRRTSEPALAASWDVSHRGTVVTLHDDVIDRPSWIPCEGSTDGFAILPHKLTSILLDAANERRRSKALHDLATSLGTPLLGATLQLLLRAWCVAVRAAFSDGTFAELLALDDLIARLWDALLASAPGYGSGHSSFHDNVAARSLTSFDLAVAEHAIDTFLSTVVDSGEQEGDDDAEGWLQVTLPLLEDMARVSTQAAGV